MCMKFQHNNFKNKIPLLIDGQILIWFSPNYMLKYFIRIKQRLQFKKNVLTYRVIVFRTVSGMHWLFFCSFQPRQHNRSVGVSLSRPSVLLFRLWCPSRFSVYQLCNFLSNATLKWYSESGYTRHVSGRFSIRSDFTFFFNLSAYVNSFMSF